MAVPNSTPALQLDRYPADGSFLRSAMKKRRIYLGGLACGALIVAVGLRTSTGQGYSAPIVLPREATAEVARMSRTLELRLTNRESGRPQFYRWSLSIPTGGSVEIECHEWIHVRFYGLSLPGMPRNSFHRIIPLDKSEEGVADPYHFTVRWRLRDAEPDI